MTLSFFKLHLSKILTNNVEISTVKFMAKIVGMAIRRLRSQVDLGKDRPPTCQNTVLKLSKGNGFVVAGGGHDGGCKKYCSPTQSFYTLGLILVNPLLDLANL